MDANGQTVLEETYDMNYEPTEKDVLQYCHKILKLDPKTEKDLMYIAREGIVAPLPPDWRPVKDHLSGKVYYYNFRTKESNWDHPCDQKYRNILAEERRKRGRVETAPVTTTAGSKKKGAATGRVGKPTSMETETQVTSDALGQLGTGGRLAPLAPIRGLPPLKMPTDALSSRPPLGKLAPAQSVGPSVFDPPKSKPSTFSQPPNSAAGSAHSLNPLEPKGRLGFSIGGGSGGVGGGGRDFLGSSALEVSPKISTKFEEEEEEEDEEEEEPAFNDTAYRSKLLGENALLDLNNLLKIEEEFDEDLHSSEDNVSEELMKMLQSDEEEAVDADVFAEERPTAPLGSRPLLTEFSPTGGPPSPVLSPLVPSSLSPYPALMHQSSETSALIKDKISTSVPTTTSLRATTTSTSSVITTTNARGVQPLRFGPSITAPPGVKLNTTSTTLSSTRGITATTTSSNQPAVIKTGSTAGAAPPASLAPSSTVSPVTKPAGTIENISKTLTVASSTLKPTVTDSKTTTAPVDDELKKVEEENKKELERLKEEHEKAVKELRDQLSTEFEKEKDAVKKEHETEIKKAKDEGRHEVEKLHREGKEELERVRKTVEEQRAKEEKNMRDRKLQAINDLRKTLKDEEEEEEAMLVEEKEKNIRQVKQKISGEREKEEVKLKEEAAKARQELISKLATEKQEEEMRLRTILNKEMSEVKAEEEEKAGEEKENVKREFQRQLQVFQEEQEEKHNKERAEIEENFRGQLEAFKREEQEKVQTELERKQLAEEERERTVQKQQEDLATLKQEIAAELELKRSELQQQNQAALDTIKRESEIAVAAAKSEHQMKIEQEREKLKSEFETTSAALQRKHEETMEQLKRDLASLEDQNRTQLQIQSEKLKEMQEEYDQKQIKLQQLQQEVEQQSVKVEQERKRLKDEQERVHLRHYSTRRSKRHFRDHHREDDDLSEEASNSGEAMQLDDLEPPKASSSPLPSARTNRENVREMLEENQRTLLRILTEEENSKEAASEIRREKTKRREEKRRREKSTTSRSPSSKSPKTKKKHAPLPTSSVKSKLREEVKALGELGEKLRSSRQLLLSREQDLHNLHSHLSEELTSDETRIRDNSNSPRAPLSTTQMGYDRDRDSDRRRQVDVSGASFNLRTPVGGRVRSSDEGERGRRSRSSQGRRSRRSNRSRGTEDRRENTYTTVEPETRERHTQTRVPPPPEGFHLLTSASEEEKERSGSPISNSRSPSPSNHASTEDEDQMTSQREMVKSLHNINRQLHNLTSQISQGSPRRVIRPRHHIAPMYYYPTSPPHPSVSARWADPVPLPTSHLQSKQRMESTKPKRHSQPTQSFPQPLRMSASDSHVTTSPAHIHHPGYASEGVDWVGQFSTQFPSNPPLCSPLRPISAPIGAYGVPHAQLVMDSDRNIHLVHM